jgi:hypothetical protein
MISRRNLFLYQFTKECNKADCNKYHGTSLLPTSYKMLSLILSRLSPYRDKMIGDRQYEFKRNRSTTGQKFCVRHVLQI